MLYLDYAASTPLCQESLEEMQSTMEKLYGNPSAAHGFGRAANVYIEQARSTVAKCLQCNPSNIVFTSGATEAINLGIRSICIKNKPQQIITSPLEHLSVLKSIQQTSDELKTVKQQFVSHHPSGEIDLQHLDVLLSKKTSSLVCLTHANNEIGNLLAINEVGKLCQRHNAIFFCDMVQTIGKYAVNLTTLPVDFAVASAHKFYGPKGIGILYVKDSVLPLLVGGAQERNLRAGTENIYAIGGAAVALEIRLKHLTNEMNCILKVKQYCIDKLRRHFSDVVFVGNCSNGGLYNLINFYLPNADMDTLLIRLDVAGIAVSGGSACSSGTEQISHVIRALGIEKKTIRLSLGKDTTTDNIDFFIQTLISLTES